MIQQILANKTNASVLMKSLRAGDIRNKVIGNNIANVTTPEFKRSEVRFEDELRSAINSTRLKGARTSGKHMALGRKNVTDVSPTVYKPNDPTLPSGVNNVDIDMEMAKLTENQIVYSMGLRFMKGIYSKLNAAVAGRSMN